VAFENRRKALIQLLLSDFSKLRYDSLNVDFIDDCLPLLFDILKSRVFKLLKFLQKDRFRNANLFFANIMFQNDVISLQSAEILSRIFAKADSNHHDSVVQTPPSNTVTAKNSAHRTAQIDPSFVNNPEMSDVQFLVEEKLFYAHRIVLANCSPEFRRLLVQEGSKPTPQQPISIEGVSFETFKVGLWYFLNIFDGVKFKLAISFLYNDGTISFESIDTRILCDLMQVSVRFRLENLRDFVGSFLTSRLTTGTCLEIFFVAKVCFNINYETLYVRVSTFKTSSAETLQENCLTYFLQNLPQMMTDNEQFRNLVYNDTRKLCKNNNLGQNVDILSLLLTKLVRRLEGRELSSSKCCKF